MSETVSTTSKRKRSPFARALGWMLGIVLPVVVLIVGAFGAVRFMQTSPHAERAAGHQNGLTARLVEVETLRSGEERVIVEVMGTVKPAKSVLVQPQVGGRIVSVSPNLEPGGVFAEGEELLRIDASDYELEVRQREVAVSQAESDLKIEMGQQEIARQDFELLGEEIAAEDQGLVLREPQLEKARANLEAARVALESARLDLSRTRLVAPFDSLVLTESAELGAIASPSTEIAELVGIDQFWVELAVPVDEFRWIELPGPGRERGSEVLIRDEAAWPEGQMRTGHVVRYRGDVNEESRMATLIVAVDDPLAREPSHEGEPRLLLNSYVRAQILGETLPDAVSISRAHLHQGDTIWVMNEEDRLEIREVPIAWRGPDRVLLQQGVRDGERLVTTRVSAPVEGMGLRTLAKDGSKPVTPSGLEPVGVDSGARETSGIEADETESPAETKPAAKHE